MATFDCLGGERNYYLTFKGEDQLRNPSMKLRPIASMNGRSKAMPCLLATGENGRLVIQGECVCKEAYFILDMMFECAEKRLSFFLDAIELYLKKRLFLAKQLRREKKAPLPRPSFLGECQPL